MCMNKLDEIKKFKTVVEPLRILRSVALVSNLKAKDFERLRGAIFVLYMQGFMTNSTLGRYFRLFENIILEKTKLRDRK